MSFLTPLFLVGAAAVGLPVLFHLIRRTTRNRQLFSSLMFLLPSPPRLTRRSRLEHLLLLFLRCSVLCLLALGFARPYLRRALPPAEQTRARRLLLMLDTSASMRRSDLWPEAKAKAAAYLKQILPADQVAVFAFDRQLTPVMTFEQWNAAAPGERAALALARLDAIAPGWSDTHLGSALIQASELLTDTGSKAGASQAQLVLISDLQQGSHLDPLQGYEWPRGLQLSVETLQPRYRGNASLEVAPESDDASAQPASGVRVRVSNTPDSTIEQFQIGWARPDGHGFIDQTIPVYVPAGQSRIVLMQSPARASERLLLTGDENDFDDSVFVAPSERQRVKVLYLGSEQATDPKQPLYFLERAFHETRRRVVHVVAQSADKPLSRADLSDAALTIVADQLPAEVATEVRARVTAGKTALVLAGTDSAAASLARILGIDSLETVVVQPKSYALLSEINFQHPIFAPFADPRFSDFARIHFWRYRKIDASAIPAARVLARFDSGDPALLEIAMGKGRILALTAGWQPEESQLALSTKFVPLLYSMLEQSGVPAPLSPQFHVGDAIPLAVLAGTTEAAFSVRRPDGSEVNLPAGQTNLTETLAPGVYTVGTQSPKRFAVNLDPAESLTMPVPVDELERLGAPLTETATAAAASRARRARLVNSELENRQKLWRWALLLAVGTLIAETWLGGWTARNIAGRTTLKSEPSEA